MPVLCEFDTQSVRSWDNPKADTRGTVCFSRSLVARPRLAHGIRALDIGNHANIRIKSVLPYSTSTWIDCHIMTWLDTTLYSGVSSVLALAPGELEFLMGEHMRGANGPSAVRVQFERRFVTPPKVVVFLNHIDLDRHHNWRLSVSASDVDVSGFTLHIDTWGDTVLHFAQACWVAYPEDREHIWSTSLNTMDFKVGLLAKPQPEKESKDVTFDGVSFWKDPSVFVALNFIDVDCKANLRLYSYVDGISRTGLVCHIGSWHDTVVYAAGVSIIAFN